MNQTAIELRKLDLRSEVRVLIEAGVNGIVQDLDNNLKKEVWLDMITDKTLEAFSEFLPEPVDIRGKYEVEEHSGVNISLSSIPSDAALRSDAEQLDYLARYADDEGYNRYYHDVRTKLAKCYTTE